MATVVCGQWSWIEASAGCASASIAFIPETQARRSSFIRRRRAHGVTCSYGRGLSKEAGVHRRQKRQERCSEGAVL
ncbi:hypothetical protein BD309DRAFT_949441, partial [Dichomitus squalens]